MWARALALRSFGCFSSASFSFEPGVNLVCGPNGSGKTTLLSALVVCSGRRPRGGGLSRFASWGERGFAMRGLFCEGGSELEVRLSFSSSSSSATLSGRRASLREVRASVPAMDLISGGLSLVELPSSDRRRLLNLACDLVFPDYEERLLRLGRLLEQKRVLLGSGRSMASLEEMLEEEARAIWSCRERLVAEADRFLSSLWPSGLPPARLRLRAKLPSDSVRSLELRSRRVLWGPQSDELEVEVGGRPALQALSRGLRKLLSYVIYYSCGLAVAKAGGRTPFFAFDDALSDLDSRWAGAFFEASISLPFQVLMTSCADHFREGVAVWRLEGSRLTRAL